MIDVKGKTKEGLNSCLDLVNLDIKKELHPIPQPVGDIPPGTTRWYMGRTIRGGPAREIKAYMARLQVVLDIVIVPNRILYL